MDITYLPNTIGYLDITFGPKWDYIPLTRNYIENFLMVKLADKRNVSKIAIAASELLENAVKYSTKEGIRIVVRKYEDKEVIELVVSNFTDKEQGEKLVSYIENMNQYDPLQFYIMRMKEVAAKKEARTGLGLPRVRAEGQAKIEAKYKEETGIIEIKAIFNYS